MGVTGQIISEYTTNTDISIASFNCYGYKSSAAYCEKLFNNCDITFLSEHWLTVAECLHLKKDFETTHWTSVKSSMDPCTLHVGRPFGGVGFICRKNKHITYTEVDTKNERLQCIKLSDKTRTIMYLMGVYMPYNDNTRDSLAEYINILDTVAAHLETVSAPTILLGDFNTSLPQTKSLHAKWYKCRPMSERSLLLYDFICNTNMCVGNFAQTQQINHTYAKGSHKSYIDHVLLPRYLMDSLLQCEIRFQDPEMASDHFPIITSLRINLNTEENSYEDNIKFPNTYWNKPDFCSKYRDNVHIMLNEHCIINPDEIPDHLVSQSIEKLYNDLCTTFHRSAEAAAPTNVKSRHHRSKHWWSADCTEAKSRNRFWHKLWIENSKPTHGAVYECYRESKKHFRRMCRLSKHNVTQEKYGEITNYLKHRNINKLWAAIKHMKNVKQDVQVELSELREYFCDKFDNINSDSYGAANEEISRHFNSSPVNKDFVFSEALVRKYIMKLKASAAPGIDGITPHHLKQALDSDLTLHLSSLLTLCCRHSVVPEAFTRGLLVPIPKPGKDPTTPEGYRPIMISVIISKLLEYFILDEVANHQYSPLMFGFIPDRGTDMAIAVAHDVCQYSLSQGSPVHLASLDAEGAFDFIPHSVLFYKTMDIIPTMSWKLMVYWYGRIKARLVIGRHVDAIDVPIRRGTRQGGLTSPMLFNMFYTQLVDTLSNSSHGVIVDKHSYNVFAYADDLLLASTTVSGLQALIDTAVDIITTDGLRFNPHKTVCCTFGPNIYTSDPEWNINGVTLKRQDHVRYLGAMLGAKGSELHSQERIRSARKSYYALQPAGLHKDGVDPFTSAYIHKTVISPSLTYGCNAIYMTRMHIQELSSCQGQLLKVNLGLYKTSRTSPLLSSLRIPTVQNVIKKDTVGLVYRCFRSNSAARTLYTSLLHLESPNKTLLHRYKAICDEHSLPFVKSMFIKNSTVKYVFTSDGIVESLQYVFSHFTPENRILAQELVKSY